MDLLEYLEKTFNDCSNPCFVLDYDTEELLFINQSLEKKFQIFHEYQGKKATDLFRVYVDETDFCPKEKAKEGDYFEQRIYSKGLQTHLRANTTLINKCEKKLLLTKYFMTSVDKKRVETEHSFEHAMEQCVDILTQSNQENTITQLLALLSNFYTCELAFICEFEADPPSLTAHHIWKQRDSNVSLPSFDSPSVPLSDFIDWVQQDIQAEFLSIDASDKYIEQDTIGGKILESYNISNLTLKRLCSHSHKINGVVGLCNRSQPIYDDRLLKAVSHFVVERFNEASTIKALQTMNEMDVLTGFFNRTKYAEQLSILHNAPHKSLGVLFVNLNGLRKTNEYFGFEVGDVQIQKTAAILREHFSEDFYRISGDEFVAFMPNWEKSEFETKVDALHCHLKANSHEVNFSMGHSWEDGNYNVGNLVKVADTVMMINKQAFYFNTLHDNEDIIDTILRDLFRALAEDEFLVYLQPQINLDTEEVVGAEALIRRYDRKHQKMVFPDTFIPLYEKNSIIRHVDLFVIRKVCQILVDWTHHDQAMPISVNLSRVTLMEHGIVKTITAILDEYNVAHDLIVIEITERIGLVENEVTSSLVDEFKEQGFRLSLDDFGCAYSNIVTLSQIEVDEVKIDKSLVDNLVSNSKNRVIVKNMLLMCSELDNTFSLAEGIETEEQAEFLRSVHCHLGQGYLYSQPIPNEEFFHKYIKGSSFLRNDS